ncbi:MAG: MATE family efflux transporter, partial [Thermoplasmata archaeon]|nr:MATE family efflux transporter [Thermoplasmata archaeon]
MKSEKAPISGPPATRGVALLKGDPKKALIKLALPMIVAMSVHTIYNLVDAIWVSGLGPDALSSVGFFFPF